jgi:hypothetical protein
VPKAVKRKGGGKGLTIGYVCNVYQKRQGGIKTIHRIVLISTCNFLYLEAERNGLTCKFLFQLITNLLLEEKVGFGEEGCIT